ncbi:MAG: hypothetical protein AAGK97_15295, partial [Bacteroidota bacterium]
NKMTQGLSECYLAKKEMNFKKIDEHLEARAIIPYTFTINQLKGTPSWLLFDYNYNILSSWFGHITDSKIDQIIEYYLAQKTQTR